MKKLLPFVLVLLLAVSLCACGSKTPSSSENSTKKENGEGTKNETKANAKKKEYEAAAKAFMEKVMAEDYEGAYAMLKIAGEPFITEQDFKDYIPESSLKAFAGEEMKLTSAETKIGDVSVVVTLKYGVETVALDMAEVDGKILVDFDEFSVRKWYIKAFEGAALTLNGVSVNDNAKGTVSDGIVTYKLNYVPNRTVLIEMETPSGKKLYRGTPENGAVYEIAAMSVKVISYPEWKVLLDGVELTGGSAGESGTIIYIIPRESGQKTKTKLRVELSYTAFEYTADISPGDVIDLTTGFSAGDELEANYWGVTYTELAVDSLISSFVKAKREAIGFDQFMEDFISHKLSEYDQNLLAKVVYEKVMALQCDLYDLEVRSGSKIYPKGNDLYEVTFKISWDTCYRSGSMVFSIEDETIRMYASDDLHYLEPEPDPDFK